MVEAGERNWVIDKIGDEPPKLKDSIYMWAEMQELYCKYNAVSLGWGSPDFKLPDFLKDALAESMEIQANNQYGRSNGHPLLVKAIADVYGPMIDRKLDPMTEVLVSQGANGCLNTCMQTFVNKGDEVVVFTPCFPIYNQ